MRSGPQISASILNADFAHLGEEVRRADAGGVDSIHLDVMDGHFVDNLTMGPVIVESVRPASTLPFHAHLMITNPLVFLLLLVLFVLLMAWLLPRLWRALRALHRRLFQPRPRDPPSTGTALR